MSKKLKQMIIAWVIILFMSMVCLGHGEVLKVEVEDQKDIQITQLQAQVTSLNVALKILLKNTGCSIEQGQIICPDKKKVEIEKK